jgi:hypothetical protein
MLLFGIAVGLNVQILLLVKNDVYFHGCPE